MSRIESRPSKRELGEYIFFVDVELKGNSIDIKNSLYVLLEPMCKSIIYFGSYQNITVNI